MAKGSRGRIPGWLLGLAFLLIAGGVVLFVASVYRPSGSGGAITAGEQPAPEATDIASLGEQAQAARLQFVDRRDPTRLGGELSFDRSDPQAGGLLSLVQPRAWMYLRDGRTVYVRADAGTVKMPSPQQQPESGEFSGNVEVRMFAPRAVGSAAINVETDAAALLATMPRVKFDTALLELSTSDAFVISTADTEFRGQGLIVRGNQVQDRLEFLKVEKSEWIKYRVAERAGAGGGGASAAAAPAAAVPPTATTAAAPRGAAGATTGAAVAAPATARVGGVKEDLYKAVLADNVVVTQGGRKLTADALSIWLRVRDNRLPDDAFGAVAEAGGSGGAGARRAVVSLAAGAGGPVALPLQLAALALAGLGDGPAATGGTGGAGGKESMFVPGERDLMMVWSGALTMAPLPAGETPTELAGGNHLTARFDAIASERVEFSDSEMGATGWGASIGYFATTRWAELMGGPRSKMVSVSAPSTGRFTAPGVRVNLGTGNATIPGGGVLASFALAAGAKGGADGGENGGGAVAKGEALPGDRVRQITWTDQADFKLRTQDGRVVGELEWAQFQGGVEARDRLSVVSGDVLRAEFVRAPEQASSLSRLSVKGKVLAVGGPRSIDPAKAGPSDDPFVTAEALEVSFKPSNAKPGEVDPTFAVASGNVTASGSGARITGQTFEVALERGTGEAVDDIVVGGVTGEGGVRLERASDGVSAKADALKADGKARTAELTGRNVAVTRGASTILGTQMRLEEGEGRLLVFGAGSFQHEQGEAEGTSGGATRLRATWTKSMAFNNAKGTLEAVGDTEIRALGALSLQTARADRLRLNLTPAAELGEQAAASAGGAGGASEAATLDGRRLLRAEIEGSVLTRDGTARASVESRRYRAPDAEKAKAVGGGRVLEQVLFIEGDRIVADDVRGTLEVPGPGRAVILDQSVEGGSESEEGAGGGEVGMPRGTSRFVWDGSLVYVRDEGKLSLLGGVELTHKPMGATVAARMTCERLDATIDAAGQTAAAGQAVRTGGTQLVRADAVGNVLAESGPSRLQADRFEYDARSGRGTAIADDGKRVTLSDDRRGTPYVAKKLAWDIVGDRVEITSPAPLAVPR